MHELMFQAGVKGMSERSELIPCIYLIKLRYILVHRVQLQFQMSEVFHTCVYSIIN